MTTCPHCGVENVATQRFCGSCGASLMLTCPGCQETNPLGFRFCGCCGATLLTDISSAPPAPHEAVEERRWATVVFADLCGFTALSERMDPEDVHVLVGGCLREMGRVVEDLDGYVARLVGDELLAVFGAPVARGDDAERAVRAALEIQRRISGGGADPGLSLRVGVNTGEMVFGAVGPDTRRDVTVYGDVVNVGKRLEEEALPGGVLVGEETWRATRGSIAYEEVGPILVKGKVAPVGAWRAKAPLTAPGQRQLSDQPIVGRDPEIELLSTIWDRVVAEREGHLVTVLGPPGIGKTRVEREFSVLITNRGGRVLRGRSLPYGERTGYGALALQLKDLAGILDTDSVPAVRGKLDSALGPLFPGEQADELASQLALLIGIGEESATADRQSLFFLVRRVIEALSRDRPTLVVFEDLHWADPSLLDLLEYLAGRISEAPVMFLALARPELLDVRPTWAGGLAASTTLPLKALSADASRSLAERLLPHDAAPATIERLTETAGGNPLFLEELAASLIETGLQPSDLPTSVKAIIAARIDALPSHARSTLLNASVFGKIFWAGPLERLGTGGELEHVLENLEGRDFIRRHPTSRLEGDREYLFKHMLIREVAYSILPKAARRERHAEVARFLEEAAGDRLAEAASLLAHHWREAGDDEQTLRFLVMAAEHASRTWAKSEAVSLYTEALELVAEEDGDRRRSLLLRRGITLLESGKFPAAASELDALLPDLQGDEEMEALLGRARLGYWLSDPEAAESSARRATELAEALNDDRLRSRAQAAMSLAVSLDGQTAEAVALGEQAVDSWQPGSDAAELAIHLGFLGAFEYWVGRYERAAELSQRGYDLGMEVHEIQGMMLSGGDLGMALTGLGRHEEALQVLQRVITQGRELELIPTFTSRTMNMRAGTLRELLDLEAARRLNEEAIELAGRAGFSYGEVQGKIDLLVTDLVEGHVGRAEKAWPGLWQETLATKGLHQWLMAGRLATARAEIALAAGRAEVAAEAAREAIAFADRHGRLKYQVASRLTLGCALLEMRRAIDGTAELRRALAGAERLGHPPSTWRVAASLATALAATGDDEGAQAAHAQLTTAVDGFATSLSEQRRARFLAAPQLTEALAMGR